MLVLYVPNQSLLGCYLLITSLFVAVQPFCLQCVVLIKVCVTWCILSYNKTLSFTIGIPDRVTAILDTTVIVQKQMSITITYFSNVPTGYMFEITFSATNLALDNRVETVSELGSVHKNFYPDVTYTISVVAINGNERSSPKAADSPVPIPPTGEFLT